MDNRPIGVFDSGVGGLTVVKEIMKVLPNEDIIYFGDTARVPYGTKSPETVTKYAIQDIKFLLTYDIKAIVIACNTASATSLETVKQEFGIPIIGVVNPGAKSAVKNTKNKRIGIIGTQGTISSCAYQSAVKSLDNDIQIFGTACSLFVPLVEEGWLNNEVVKKTAQTYLKEMKDKDIDTLILGCTHYPLLIDVIADTMGDKVTLINPALETANELYQVLSYNDLIKCGEVPSYKYFLSDISTKFETIANNCLNKKVGFIEKVDIEKY